MEQDERSQILANIDAESLLERITGSQVQRTYGNELKMLCPFHDERTPSFHYNVDKGVYQCFGCGAKGDLFDLIGTIKELSFKEVADGLAKLAGITFTHKGNDTDNSHDTYTFSLTKAAVARNYLLERGIDPEIAIKAGVGYCPKTTENTRLNGRITFPLHRLSDGRTIRIGYSGRAITATTKRWMHSEGVKTNKAFFIAGDISSKTPVLVEGPFDALALWQSGNVNLAMAYLGSFISDEQARALSEVFDDIIIWPDFDEAGERGLIKSISSTIANGMTARVVCDPSDSLSCDDPHKISLRGDSSEYIDHTVQVSGGSGKLFQLLNASRTVLA